MAVADDSYSRLIAWLKIILPLIALAILSTLFLVSRSMDPALSVPIAKGTLEELAREPKIRNPSFSGVTINGAAITLLAETAQPMTGENRGLRAINIRGTLEAQAGQQVEFIAPVAMIDTNAETAELSGGITLETSTGYLVETGAILADLAQVRISTAGPITASGPLGRVSAGQMVLQQQTGGDQAGDYELVFKNGVRLIYLPQQN